MLTLNNTRPGESYQVWFSQEVNAVFTNWGLELTVLGATGDTTQTNVAMSGRSNLWFRVEESRNYTTNSIFPGLNYADTLAIVPDTMAAAGPSHLCELLNEGTAGGVAGSASFAVYDKSGGHIMQTNMTNLFAFVNSGTPYPTGTLADPRILFDSQANCWVASAIDRGSSQVILVVCTNANNPTNLATGWARYVLRVAQPGADTGSDRVGVDENGLYVSVVHRDNSSNTNAGHTVVAIKKADVYLGTNISGISTYLTNNNDFTLWTLQPAVNFDSVPSNGYAWFVAKGPPTLNGSYQGGAVMYRRLQWLGTNAAWLDTNWLAGSASANYQDYYDLDGTSTTTAPNAGGGEGAAIGRKCVSLGDWQPRDGRRGTERFPVDLPGGRAERHQRQLCRRFVGIECDAVGDAMAPIRDQRR